MKHKSLFTFLFVVVGLAIFAQPYYSPFNPGVLDVDEQTPSYSFLVSGHFYGGSSSGASGYPASTILAGLDVINSSKADFFLSTGDMFVDAHADRERYQTSFFNKLSMPLFNAVGNHDVDSDMYEKHFGNTDQMIELGNDRLLILNAERNDSKLDEKQLELIQNSLNASMTGGLRNLFILTHRPIWAEDIDKYSGLFKENTRSMTGSNFGKEVMPLLQKIAENSSVYWFSGSMGGSAPSPIFIDNYSKGIHFIQSAIRDRQSDAFLKANVTNKGVSFEAISLTGKLMPEVNELGMEYWAKNRRSSAFKWRLVPYYLKSALTHRFFWYGVFTMLILTRLLKFLYRRLG